MRHQRSGQPGRDGSGVVEGLQTLNVKGVLSPEIIFMGKYKGNPKQHMVSIRVSDEEKALLNEMTKRDRTNISSLIRGAVFTYASVMNISFSPGEIP
jgi:hypothetical protein